MMSRTDHNEVLNATDSEQEFSCSPPSGSDNPPAESQAAGRERVPRGTMKPTQKKRGMAKHGGISTEAKRF